MAASPFKTDRYDILVTGMNPHTLAAQMAEPNNPFYDSHMHPSVKDPVYDTEQNIVGGTIEVYTEEVLTSEQVQFLRQHPHVVDYRYSTPD